MATNPDPAETFNVVDLFRELTQTMRDMPDKVGAAVSREVTRAQSAPEYVSFTRELTQGVPALILGGDRQRSRSLVRASTTDVFIGTLEQLQSGFGYVLPTQAGDEIRTTDEVYALYNPEGTPEAARVSVWSERIPA